MKELISHFKLQQKSIFHCYTFPIGDKPDNQSWSGFQMINEDDPNSNYLLIFRELHNEEVEKEIALKMLAGKSIRIENIETGEVWNEEVSENGKMQFTIENQADYLFLHYQTLQ